MPHHDPEEEWPTWVVGLLFGFGSCLSFPIGAAVAIYANSKAAAPGGPGGASPRTPAHLAELQSETRKHSIAGMMAFGTGLLLFAVTVELYGQAVWELQEASAKGNKMQAVRKICCTIFFAYLGAAGYIVLNRWLEAWITSSRKDSGAPDEQTPLVAAFAAPAKQGSTDVSADGKSAVHQIEQEQMNNVRIGLQSWFGVFISGIPEGVLLGDFAAERRLSMVFVLSLFISNFPTALASASLLKEGGRSNLEIMGLWTFAFVFTGLLAGIMPLVDPGLGDDSGASIELQLFSAATEGLAGGSMLACICAVMLPEAYNVQGDIAGLITVSGFLLALVLKVFGGLVEDWVGGASAHIEAGSAPAVVQGPGPGLLMAGPSCTHMLSFLLARCS